MAEELEEETRSKAQQYGIFVIFMIVAVGVGLLALSLMSQVGDTGPTTWHADYEGVIRQRTDDDPTNVNVQAWHHPTKRGMDQSVRSIPRGTRVQVQREGLGPQADTVVMVQYKGTPLWFRKVELRRN